MPVRKRIQRTSERLPLLRALVEVGRALIPLGDDFKLHLVRMTIVMTALEGKRTNASSLASYLGLPRETVRRKVKELIEDGWVRDTSEGLIPNPEKLNQMEMHDLMDDLLKIFHETYEELRKALAQR